MADLNRGIPSIEQIERLEKFADTKDENDIIRLLIRTLKAFRKYNVLAYYLMILSRSVFIVLIYLALYFPGQINTQVVIPLVFLLLSARVFSRHKLLSYRNRLSRILENLFDKLLEMILQRYKSSLGEYLPQSPNIKEICKDLVNAVLANTNLNKSESVIIGNSSAVIILIIYTAVTHQPVPYELGLLVLILFILYHILTHYGDSFTNMSMLLLQDIDKLDSRLKDTKPLLTTTRIDLYDSDYIEDSETLIRLISKINILHTTIEDLIPFVFILIPILAGSQLAIPLIASMIVMSYLSATLSITNLEQIHNAQKRLEQLDELVGSIRLCGQEINSSKYLSLGKEVCDQRISAGSYDSMGSFRVEDLKYFVGRNSEKYQIHASELKFPTKKISILHAGSGSGKSVLGRVITMKYADFTAKFIGRGNFDFRCFDSLSDALSVLHFSTLRSIETSYRNILSVYLFDSSIQNSFIDKIIELSESRSYENVLKYYEDYKDYYSSVLHDQNIQDILDHKDRINPRELTIKSRTKLAELFRNIEGGLTTEELIGIGNPLLRIGLIAEYIAFTHLQKFIPESNQFFMDAILSEPPISQGQKRRVLFAIDIFLKGDLYVADELLTNLDFESAKGMLDEVISYTERYNAPILVLDQELNLSLVKYLQEKKKLGNIYTFKKSGDSGYEIVRNRMLTRETYHLISRSMTQDL